LHGSGWFSSSAWFSLYLSLYELAFGDVLGFCEALFDATACFKHEICSSSSSSIVMILANFCNSFKGTSELKKKSCDLLALLSIGQFLIAKQDGDSPGDTFGDCLLRLNLNIGELDVPNIFGAENDEE
jgi:hypothetical protein